LLSRSYDEEQEKETAWLEGCLQLPRLAVFRAARKGVDNSKIGEYYRASEQIVRYRRDVAGVNKQLELIFDFPIPRAGPGLRTHCPAETGKEMAVRAIPLPRSL